MRLDSKRKSLKAFKSIRKLRVILTTSSNHKPFLLVPDFTTFVKRTLGLNEIISNPTTNKYTLLGNALTSGLKPTPGPNRIFVQHKTVIQGLGKNKGSEENRGVAIRKDGFQASQESWATPILYTISIRLRLPQTPTA